MCIDMLAFPGHKGLLGPQGTGGLYIKDGLKIKSIMQGGTGSNSENLYQPDILPDLLESGTLNTPGIVGLGCGLGFIENFGLENIRVFKHELIKRLHEGLREIKGIKIYSKNDLNNNSGIASFNLEDIESTEISYVLDKVYGIASRAGLHCAPIAHETLGTIGSGVVRLSTGCFNTINEINLTLNALQEISLNI
jgi:cysteine desulfurase / selenocysteine lyase